MKRTMWKSGWWVVAATVVVAACGAPSPASPSPRPVPPDTTRIEPRRDSAAAKPEAADTVIGEPVGTAAEAARAPEEKEPEATERKPSPAPPARRAPRRRSPVPVLPGSLLPRERIVAFYGNPASKRMGILGELPPEEMLQRLDREVAAWRAADPGTPVRPALQLITVMAAGDPGPDSLYRVRMPDWRIQQVMDWAKRRDALLFLDIQPGRSDVPAELPRLAEWLRDPNVHLALDPEWSMPGDGIPGRQIGSMTAEDVNFAIRFLAHLVDEFHLPPKVLVVHRFTQSMLRNADQIRLDPRVQVVINMDGWGPPAQKIQAYTDIVAPEADQFTGFKLFFHNDRKGGSRMLTPEELIRLDPAPVYIQYQ